MNRGLRITALTDKGAKAILQMRDDDIKETTYKRSKVGKQWDLRIISTTPVIYQGLIKQELIDVIVNNAKRIGHIMTIDKDVMIDTYVNSSKSTMINVLHKNGVIYNEDYNIKILTDEDLDIKEMINNG